MSYFTAQELKPYLDQPNNFASVSGLAYDARLADLGIMQGYSLKPSLTIDEVQILIDEFDARLIGGSFASWKSLRPWDVVDITSTLDPNALWIGWECETSWRDQVDRSTVTKQFLSQYNHVCLDDEGGYTGAEFTWSPEPQEEHPLHFIARMGTEHNAEEHDPNDHECGTHMNVSSPAFRALVAAKGRNSVHVSAVAAAMNSMLYALDGYQREELFGREYLYGGFFRRGDAEGKNLWFEGKLFNTTYSKTIADGYIRVADRVGKALDDIAQAVLDGDIQRRTVVVINAYDVLAKGEDAILKLDAPSQPLEYSHYRDDDDDYDADYCCEECSGPREDW